jgi:hypothetical protein
LLASSVSGPQPPWLLVLSVMLGSGRYCTSHCVLTSLNPGTTMGRKGPNPVSSRNLLPDEGKWDIYYSEDNKSQDDVEAGCLEAFNITVNYNLTLCMRVPF